MEAQQFKDRAMAEVMDAYLGTHPNALVVGIMGAGHLLEGYGVPNQLRALGRQRIAALATWPADRDCHAVAAGYADLLFVVPAPAEQPDDRMARLGITLREVPEGLLVEQVTNSGLGEQAGLRQGDLVVQAAGRPINRIFAAHVLVQRQPAGTWLPLQVRRGSELIDLVVRFPVAP
jgi:predicted metalloprotease with PDZ domain